MPFQVLVISIARKLSQFQIMDCPSKTLTQECFLSFNLLSKLRLFFLQYYVQDFCCSGLHHNECGCIRSRCAILMRNSLLIQKSSSQFGFLALSVHINSVLRFSSNSAFLYVNESLRENRDRISSMRILLIHDPERQCFQKMERSFCFLLLFKYYGDKISST